MVKRAPERVVADCWDWITPEDVMEQALAAFYAACRQQNPPPGEPFLAREDGREYPWAGRADLRGAIAGLFAQRLNVLALNRGVTGSTGTVYPELPDGVQWPEQLAPNERPGRLH